jgi:cation-transporting ATPase 13A3/4/5
MKVDIHWYSFYCFVKSLEEQRDIISEDLVPGDVIIIRGSTTMQCDAVLLNGNVIVNESMLTGESIPVTKVQIPYYQSSSDHSSLNQPFDVREHNRFILFSGTAVIQTRYYGAGDVRAVVIRTGHLFYFENEIFHFNC